MRLRILIPAFAAMLAFAPTDPARAILLTLDPAAQAVTVGDPVAVALNVSGLGDFAAPSLGAWDVDIAFDASVLAFTGASIGDPGLGDQLDLFGLGSLNGAFDLGGVVDLFEVSLDFPSDLDSLQAGTFTLATLTFNALAAGTSALGLTIDDLGDSLGLPLDAASASAEVNVTEPGPGPVAVPEPATWPMVLLGFAAIAFLQRRPVV